jgi:hypothetical protein
VSTKCGTVNPIHSIVEQEAKIHEVITFPSFYILKSIKKLFFQKPVTEKNLRVLTKERGNAMKISRISCRVSCLPREGGSMGRELGKRSGCSPPEEIINFLIPWLLPKG